jgi:hypothetical protein
MYWNFVAIDAIIKNHLKINYIFQFRVAEYFNTKI